MSFGLYLSLLAFQHCVPYMTIGISIWFIAYFHTRTPVKLLVHLEKMYIQVQIAVVFKPNQTKYYYDIFCIYGPNPPL